MTHRDSEPARIFRIETNFQKLARRPGGMTREEAIKRAQTNLEELEPGFDNWLDGELQELVRTIQHGQNGIDDAWVEAAIFRCYQLRNVGTTMKSELITFIAGSLCRIFDAIIAGAECNMESIRCHVDALLLARQKSYRNLKPDQVPELVVGLNRVVENISTRFADTLL